MNAHFTAGLGSLTSSFPVFQGKFSKCAHQLCPSEPDVLAVSEVSPFVVEVALGINAQQQDMCCWLLQCLQETIHSLQ